MENITSFMFTVALMALVAYIGITLLEAISRGEAQRDTPARRIGRKWKAKQ